MLNPTHCDSIPDCDDVMRRLSDLLDLAHVCRRRACRRAGRCQGGYGPPCYFRSPEIFGEAVRDGLQDMRIHWAEQRALRERVAARADAQVKAQRRSARRHP